MIGWNIAVWQSSFAEKRIAARQSVEQNVTNVPNPLFLEYYAVD